eukprot:10099397-Alexandrium_andersonii.AAC.1
MGQLSETAQTFLRKCTKLEVQNLKKSIGAMGPVVYVASMCSGSELQECPLVAKCSPRGFRVLVVVAR